MLQCVAVCCNVLQCVAVCCSVSNDIVSSFCIREHKAEQEANQYCLRKLLATGWRRCIGCLIFAGHFPPKSPIISGSFAERDLQLKATFASSPLSKCCSVLQYVAVCRKIFYHLLAQVAVWVWVVCFHACMLQCVAECCSVLQCVAV